jgi:hypothetical protein
VVSLVFRQSTWMIWKSGMLDAFVALVRVPTVESEWLHMDAEDGRVAMLLAKWRQEQSRRD